MTWLKVIGKHPVKSLMLIMALAGCGWFFMYHREYHPHEVLVRFAKDISPFWFILSFLTLPLVGFPFTILLILAGLRFGFWGGMAIASGGVVAHHLLVYSLVRRWLRDRLRSWFEGAGYKVPKPGQGGWIWFTAVFAAVHGPPYASKLYLLALTEVPMRVYLWIGAPVYIVFCAIPVGAGSSAFEIKPLWVFLLFSGIAALAGLSYWLDKRNRSADQ